MRVIVAKKAGFCMGVRKAMDNALDAANKVGSDDSTVYTEGPLIHNPQVLEKLEKQGIRALKEDTDLSNSTVVIRAHGITPKRRQELEASGAEISDATCPRVKRVQSIIEENTKEGYSTIIVGDEGHAEVVGLLGYTDGNGYVISSPEEVSELPDMEKICIVAQTTQDMNTFAAIAEKLKQRYENHRVFDTICSSTSRRQEEVISLSEEVDAIVVVGGRGSANTNRLVQISEKRGMPTFLVETEQELNLKKLADYGVIGVTAGASTPNWLLQRVVDKVQNYQGKKIKKMQLFTEKAITILIGSFMYIGIGAASFSYSSSVLLGINPRIKFCTIATLFLFSMYVLNYFANKEAAALSEPSRAKLYERHQGVFKILGIVAAILSSVLAYTVNIDAFFCVFFASLFGIAYRVYIIPKKLTSIIRYRSLAQIPGSKEVFISIAWAVSTGLIPFLGSPESSLPSLPVVLAFTFSMVFVRTVLLDVRDVQGDRIVGKETIPIAIGKTNTKAMLVVISILLTILLIASPKIGWTSGFSYYLLPCVAYACGYLYLYHKRLIPSDLACEIITDFNFILAGIMVAIWHLFLI
ncbi:MAG: 4-hydroxy-3-methylbut-2-enyl diphosphate reductase [Candidatus Scalindua sp.]|jgi:4-hydroxy-3-methylbut-2-enyl diphosphate reductase|nr:4-hydroxy-3-methylbut-2-enyl diphosphate reductase [Candidatus Scalindua sp.]MBT6561437.1 4-hydroxy-3-methylbut-2-enyl diphosphate reductase [Candidatus Scalindua sp.]MBT7212645.1 4-hydroxy-3-methylbut-2-enyl diphosphate reductase [Candidatus Scalindua sp.]MBT7589871.1 4-hydroxy-3-methylbut-2-enyl diphosphate reductase [Candidatus Scalindua sp.]